MQTNDTVRCCFSTLLFILFSESVESKLGPVRMTAFIATCGCAAFVAVKIVSPRSIIPRDIPLQFIAGACASAFLCYLARSANSSNLFFTMNDVTIPKKFLWRGLQVDYSQVITSIMPFHSLTQLKRLQPNQSKKCLSLVILFFPLLLVHPGHDSERYVSTRFVRFYRTIRYSRWRIFPRRIRLYVGLKGLISLIWKSLKYPMYIMCLGNPSNIVMPVNGVSQANKMLLISNQLPSDSALRYRIVYDDEARMRWWSQAAKLSPILQSSCASYFGWRLIDAVPDGVCCTTGLNCTVQYSTAVQYSSASYQLRWKKGEGRPRISQDSSLFSIGRKKRAFMPCALRLHTGHCRASTFWWSRESSNETQSSFFEATEWTRFDPDW